MMSFTQMMRGGLVTGAQQLARGLPASFEGIGVRGGTHFERREPRHRIHDGLHALVDGTEHGVVPDEAQPAVSQAMEVVDHFLDSAAVVRRGCW